MSKLPISKPTNVFISLDLEMSQPSGKIIELGYVIANLDSGEVLLKRGLICNPHEELSDFIVKLTGIHQADVEKGMEIDEAYNVLIEDYNQYKPWYQVVVWGEGDMRTLRSQISKESSEKWTFGHRTLDVKTLYFAEALKKGLSYRGGLAKCMTRMGLRFFGTKHRACDDSENTFKLFRKFIKG